MSYVKIDDPSKRGEIVQDDIIARKNRLKKNFKLERAQKLNVAEAQERFFEPVPTSQALTTETLKQLDKNLEAIALTQNQLLPSSQAAIEIYDAEDTIINIDALMQDTLAGAEPRSNPTKLC